MRSITTAPATTPITTNIAAVPTSLRQMHHRQHRHLRIRYALHHGPPG